METVTRDLSSSLQVQPPSSTQAMPPSSALQEPVIQVSNTPSPSSSIALVSSMVSKTHSRHNSQTSRFSPYPRPFQLSSPVIPSSGDNYPAKTTNVQHSVSTTGSHFRPGDSNPYIITNANMYSRN